MMAFAGTGLIFFGMAALSSIIKRDLSTMGKFLFIGAIMVLVAGIANIWLQSSALMITLSVLVIGIFSAFIIYDLQRVKNGAGDELHHRHARRLPEPLQRVLGAAVDLRPDRQPRVRALRDEHASPDRQGPFGALFVSGVRVGRTRRCSPRAWCAETC